MNATGRRFAGSVESQRPKPRRNSGRVLAVAIESGPKLDLNNLLDRTASLMWHSQLVPTRPCLPRAELLRATGVSLFEAEDSDRWLALCNFDDFDLLVGVGSRRGFSDDARADNVMVEKLLQVLESPTEAGVLFGTMVLVEFNRAVRTRIGEAHVTQTLKDWDIQVVTTRGARDPLGDPSFDFAQMLDGHQAEESAGLFLRQTSDARVEAHNAGLNAFPSQTLHPLVFAHPESRRMAWNPAVVEAVREAVALIRAGATWHVAACQVGHQIPARYLQVQSDADRAARNLRRLARGQSPVPLKYLEEGGTNPAYRSETILDEADPGGALQGFIRGSTIDRQLDPFVDVDFEGMDRRARQYDFVVRGIYRRVVQDRERSNRRQKRFKLIAYELGPVDSSGAGVLSAAEFEAIWPSPNERRSRQGPAGFGYLKGVFVAEQSGPVYAESGWLLPEDGAWKTRSRADTPPEPKYSVQFERNSNRPGRGGITLGLVNARDLHRDVAAKIKDAICGEHIPVSFGWAARAQQRRETDDTLPRQLAHAESLLRQAIDDYSQPTHTAMRREVLLDVCREREEVLAGLRKALAARERTPNAPTTAVVGRWALGNRLDLVAILCSDRKFSPEATRAIQAAARDSLRDGRIWVDTETGEVRWSAELTLVGDENCIVHRPISGALRNCRRDPWLVATSFPRKWWDTATGRIPVSGPAGSDAFGGRTGSLVLARKQHVTRRIELESKRAGVALRPGVARAIPNCPEWALTSEALDVSLGLAPAVLDARGNYLARLLLDDGSTPDIDLSTKYVLSAWKEVIRRLERLEGR